MVASVSEGGNGQRPSRRNPAGRSCQTALWLALAVVAAAVAALLGALPAAGAAPGSTAPECVTVIVGADQPDGTVSRVRLEFCGNGPGGESALHDWAQGRRFILDGATAIGNGCGGKTDPCVIFPVLP